MRRYFILALAVLASFSSSVLAQVGASAGLGGNANGAGAATAKAPSLIKEASLGDAKNVHRLRDLYFSGQFTQEDIDQIKQAQIKRVITLRTEGEVDWDEKAALEEAGIEFLQIPFRKPESLTDEVFDRVRRALKDQSKKTLFHCGSANRVGGAWLPYRVLDQGVELSQALEEAKRVGLRTEFIQEKAVQYIRRQQQEASVKPGINQSFTDPELDVDKFVERFEVESREVYLCRDQIVAACELQPGDRVADVGAGTGLFTRIFADTVGKQGWVYAVDIAPRFIEHINKQAAEANLKNITGVICAENSINLPPDSADVVFICDTYHHFEYPKSTLASIRQALKADGHLVLIDFERIEGKTRPWLMGHVRAGKEVFRAEVQDAGFELIEEKKIDGFEENYFLRFRKSR